VDVVGHDWTTTRQVVSGGGVDVSVYQDDPSPVVIVAERAPVPTP
jgi:hypothetical protein